MTDKIQRFLFERTNVRGEIVTLERLLKDSFGFLSIG